MLPPPFGLVGSQTSVVSAFAGQAPLVAWKSCTPTCWALLQAPGASVTDAVALLEKNAKAIGLGEIFYGPSLALNYNVGGLGPLQDPRSPDIIVTPNVGMTYSGSTTMIGDHGGFGHDDTNVIMLVENPHFTAQTVSVTTRTAQVAPTILQALGLDPLALEAVTQEGTPVLTEVGAQLAK